VTPTHNMLHFKSGRMLFLDMLWQVVGGCSAVCSSENSVDKHTEVDR